jgi:hypothetical protein
MLRALCRSTDFKMFACKRNVKLATRRWRLLRRNNLSRFRVRWVDCIKYRGFNEGIRLLAGLGRVRSRYDAIAQRGCGSCRCPDNFRCRRCIKPGARTHIVDLATGSGDIPRLIADYARKLDAQVELDAFDQPATLEIATTLSADYPEISYREADILEWHSVETYDVVLCLARDRMSTASSAVSEQ